jgi:hypothetical protein
MKHFVKVCVIGACYLLLGACAQTGLSTQNPSPLSERIKTLLAVKGQTEHVLVQVPSTGVSFTDELIIAALNAGVESATVEKLLLLLRISPHMPIVATGRNNAVTAASVAAALKKLEPGESSAQLYYVGSPEFDQRLSAAAQAAHVDFQTLSLP